MKSLVKIIALATCLVFVFGVSQAFSAGAKKAAAHKAAYDVYQKKCLSCHDSVADPEKYGKTRDGWHLIINVMHKYGTDLTDAEADMIIDLLYDLRKGMEREAG
ncbi:MAG: cytochrome c [Desulfobulbaceae bacterium]|nr:cytochrome c [Desulfobulbaceae bacterium]